MKDYLKVFFFLSGIYIKGKKDAVINASRYLRRQTLHTMMVDF